MTLKEFCVFLVVVSVVSVVGTCLYYNMRIEPEDKISIVRHLPVNVSNITNHGNNWHTFEWNGRLFLYHRERTGYYLGESITELPR